MGMGFNIANPIGTGTDQELLEFTRAAIAQITLHGKAYTQSGKQLTREDLKSLREQVVWLEGRIAADSAGGRSGGGKVNYAKRKRAL